MLIETFDELLRVALNALTFGWIDRRFPRGDNTDIIDQDESIRRERHDLLRRQVGRTAVAVSTLRPAGEVEIDGQRFTARTLRGMIDAGTIVQVRRTVDGDLIVEPCAVPTRGA